MKSREEAWELVTSRLSTVHLRSHLLASEACMRALAARLGEDEDLWALTGLVHDIDLDEVGGDMATHGIVGAGWLEEAGYPPELTSAVRIHAGHGEPSSRLERGLVAVDPTTGFIVACALVRPDRSLESLEVKSIKKRMKEKRFAANVDRDQIRGVETLGVPTDEFLGMCLDAMRSIRRDLGL
jgi:putative nucleotidyltransferase with HDIG domain